MIIELGSVAVETRQIVNTTGLDSKGKRVTA